VRIHAIVWISDRASETKSSERYSVNYHCMIIGDGNEMMSIYSGVCPIYTPRHSVHLRYPCIPIQPPSLLEDVLDRACLRCTSRRRSNELRDAFGGRDSVNSEDALGGHDWSSLEMHSEAVTERVWRCTCRLWLSEIGGVLGGSRFGGRRDGSWDSIHWLTCDRMRNWLGAGDCRSWDDAVLGVCCTLC